MLQLHSVLWVELSGAAGSAAASQLQCPGFSGKFCLCGQIVWNQEISTAKTIRFIVMHYSSDK